MCVCSIPKYCYNETEVSDLDNWHYILVIVVQTHECYDTEYSGLTKHNWT